MKQKTVNTVRRSLVLLGTSAVFLLVAPQSKATGVLVGQCIEDALCWTGSSPTPWSDSLSAANLSAIETAAGSTTVPFLVEQNSEYTIRLSATTIVFSTSGGTVTETLGAFSGTNSYNDPCPISLPYCETDTLGDFTIPAGALSAIVSGDFGNSSYPNSAGECLYLGGTGPCTLTGAVTSTPEPKSIFLLGIGLLGLAVAAWRRGGFGMNPCGPASGLDSRAPLPRR